VKKGKLDQVKARLWTTGKASVVLRFRSKDGVNLGFTQDKLSFESRLGEK